VNSSRDASSHETADTAAQTEDYCREVEDYLCRKNEGHLIRIAGPSFDLVARWAAQGIPLKVAFGGIDRAVERYHRKGPRRRPIKIDFCDADVLDAFDEWRRAVGLPASLLGESGGSEEPDGASAPRGGRSLPAHLERILMRLSGARAGGHIGAAFDSLIDQVARELDAARRATPGLRGEARQQLMSRLVALDRELLEVARAMLDDPSRIELMREAENELAGFRDRMQPDAFARARESAFDRLLRERCSLPIVAFQ
jgi:hypothetical protein